MLNDVYSFFRNPKRRGERFTYKQAAIRSIIRAPFAPLTKLLVWLGFANIDYSYVHGPRHRLHLGKRCSTMNTVFNVVSGDIFVGEDTYFGHGCQVLTGEHRFHEGQRASFVADAPFDETPLTGNDIHIGSRCFVASGAIITKGVTIGDDVLIAASAVVIRDIPSQCFVAGVPAKILYRETA